MDQSELRRLASQGLGSFPPEGLTDLAEWCRDFCWASGNVRYCILNDVFAMIHRAWDAPVLASTSNAISDVLWLELPPLLTEQENEAARVLAVAMRSSITAVLASRHLP